MSLGRPVSAADYALLQGWLDIRTVEANVAQGLVSERDARDSLLVQYRNVVAGFQDTAGAFANRRSAESANALARYLGLGDAFRPDTVLGAATASTVHVLGTTDGTSMQPLKEAPAPAVIATVGPPAVIAASAAPAPSRRLHAAVKGMGLGAAAIGLLKILTGKPRRRKK